KQLLQFRPDALRRELAHPVLEAGAGLDAFGIRPSAPIPGEEAEEAQNTQIVFLDALFGVPDEPQRSRLDVPDALDEIDDSTVRLGVDGVDGEVAPRRIRVPVSAELHHGVTAVGLHVGTQRCYL